MPFLLAEIYFTLLYYELNSFRGTDLRQQNIHFESIWIEIKNKNSKNIICGCLYRHPRHDLSEFLEYLER